MEQSLEEILADLRRTEIRVVCNARLRARVREEVPHGEGKEARRKRRRIRRTRRG